MKAKLVKRAHLCKPTWSIFNPVGKLGTCSLTDGPKQILAGAPDKLERKPELGFFSRRGEWELAQAVVDAQVDLHQATLP